MYYIYRMNAEYEMNIIPCEPLLAHQLFFCSSVIKYQSQFKNSTTKRRVEQGLYFGTKNVHKVLIKVYK